MRAFIGDMRASGVRQAAATISMLGVATVIGAVMVFLTQTLLARELGPSDYGMFASSLATVTMIAPLAGFGITQFMLKVYGVEGWHATRWQAPAMKFCLLTTALAILSVITWALTGAPHDDTRFMLLTLWPVILSVFAIEMMANKTRLEDRFKQMALWQMAIPGSRLLVALLLMLIPNLTGRFVAVSYCLISIGVFLWSLPQLRAMYRGDLDLKGHGPKPDDDAWNDSIRPTAAAVWSEAWAYGVYAALYPIFFQISTILLKYLQNNAQAGLYSIGLAIMTAIYLIPSTIYQKFLLAKLHRWAAHDQPTFWLVYRRGNVGMTVLGIMVSLALVVISPWAVPLLFGPKYVDVVGILYVLALCPPIRFLSTSMGSALLTGNNMSRRVYAIAAGTVAAIALNVLLIPRYQATGAAWATVAAETVLLLGTWIGVRSFRLETPVTARHSAETDDRGGEA